jgi:hypothetical protein
MISGLIKDSENGYKCFYFFLRFKDPRWADVAGYNKP